MSDAVRQLEETRDLKVLQGIRVASPCRESWQGMTGDDRVRACARCNQHVYNLSSMTRDETERLIDEHTGRLCVRYFQRSDGTILFADCMVQRPRRGRAAVAVGLAASIASAIVGYETPTRYSDETWSEVAGGVSDELTEPLPPDPIPDLQNTPPGEIK